ncbi:hypothetical protein BpHYR1_009725 [Brachionus plicatilis]|uniref:Uncharacterized protein n=1 Tax=Brachionus plicatilis TaxID=10195 RepID=A0A3M7R4Q3_BRAPC|nr:hypothetical protein BpHYR1_009725 [Brachionus plicatilis]
MILQLSKKSRPSKLMTLSMETTGKMFLKRKLNSNPFTRTLINGLIEESKGNGEKIISELEGIFTHEIGNSEEPRKLCEIKVKEMYEERKELEKDKISQISSDLTAYFWVLETLSAVALNIPFGPCFGKKRDTRDDIYLFI